MKNTFILICFLIVGCSLTLLSCSQKTSAQTSKTTSASHKSDPFVNTGSPDLGFVSTLSSAGIFSAAMEIGLNADTVLSPLSYSTHHSYRRYRWSVGYHANGGVMISAMPPEEEMGWTPWERWYKDEKGLTKKESWVMYPLKDPTPSGVARWYKLEDSSLTPLFMHKPASLEEGLRRARVYEAAAILGFDVNEKLIRPLNEKGRQYYTQCRWVIIPHILGGDAPVIYILPPMNRSDDWPWESWYSDGKTPLIHHVHYTKQRPGATLSWKEFPNAPQRPPEIFGVAWYWYDDLELKPTMTE